MVENYIFYKTTNRQVIDLALGFVETLKRIVKEAVLSEYVFMISLCT